MPQPQELPPETAPDPTITRDAPDPHQNTPRNRFIVTVVGAIWAFCGIVAIPQLLQQPWKLKLISGFEMAVAAIAFGLCNLVWGISAATWAARIAKWAGSHLGLLFLIIALPTVIDFVLNRL